ncbi:hypothetical protein [Bradyrhizobium glycinis]|nr:hypothetical protein [Bradyrhizobium glycinis]MBH5371023.1 hypothetical protein [Bradyrhizobium glycinis]
MAKAEFDWIKSIWGVVAVLRQGRERSLKAELSDEIEVFRFSLSTKM